MTDTAASIRARLLNLARDQRVEFQSLLTRFAAERLLRRVEKSRFRDEFVLKGALLFSAWLDRPYRPTRDVDFLGMAERTVAELETVFREIVSVRAEDDGLVFEPHTIRGAEIREGQTYQGVRLQIGCSLAGARIQIQVDVGFGDVVVPSAVSLEFPTLLEVPAPNVLTYPKESVVAEKFEAMVRFGITNSRMKDFYDVWALAKEYEFQGPTLTEAIARTFEQRGTSLPRETPLALTEAFAEDESKSKQWKAFVQRGQLESEPPELVRVVIALADFLMPAASAAAGEEMFKDNWVPGGPWGRGSV